MADPVALIDAIGQENVVIVPSDATTPLKPSDVVNIESSPNLSKIENFHPIIASPPFLLRNHIGFQHFKHSDDVVALKNAVSFESYQRLRAIRNLSRSHKPKKVRSKDEKLEDALVDVKRRQLLNFFTNVNEERAPTLIVIELFNLLNVINCSSNNVTVMIYMVGTNEDGSVISFVEEVHKHVTSGQKDSPSSVIEYIPPKPTNNITELYLVGKTKFQQFQNSVGPTMRGRRSRVQRASSDDTSSIVTASSSTSDDLVTLGATKIATKQSTSNQNQSPWAVQYRTCGLTLLSSDQIAYNNFGTRNIANPNVVDLAERCRRSCRSGAFSTLRVEISNEHGYGTFAENEVTTGRVTRQRAARKKKPILTKEATDALESGTIEYNVDQLKNLNLPMLMKAGFKAPVDYKCRTTAHWMVNNQGRADESFLAHKSGHRSYHCLFCSKTFPFFESLKFHLEQSYPSFMFKFESGSIVVSLNDVFQELHKKIETSQTFGLKRIQYSKESNSSKSSSSSDEKGVKKRQNQLLPYEQCTASTANYSKVSAPGLYGHEINTSFMEQMFKHRFHEITDVDPLEAKFFTLWNMFNNTQRENRHIDIKSMFQRLTAFVKKHHSDIEENHLRIPFIAFLTYCRNIKYLSEAEFCDLVMYGTQFENNWHGHDHVVPKVVPEVPKRRRHRKKGK